MPTPTDPSGVYQADIDGIAVWELVWHVDANGNLINSQLSSFATDSTPSVLQGSFDIKTGKLQFTESVILSPHSGFNINFLGYVMDLRTAMGIAGTYTRLTSVRSPTGVYTFKQSHHGWYAYGLPYH